LVAFGLGAALLKVTLTEAAGWGDNHENSNRVLSFLKMASPCSCPSLLGLKSK
jgi:hypothetical protein